ncbi:hypothetical protein [Rhodococcus sp. NPDC058521]|uniref:hypothetical protein n=1 Tax=Rhodococcus sp. NPDC058521 TaxID=3346536 RepID=UPI0036524850
MIQPIGPTPTPEIALLGALVYTENINTTTILEQVHTLDLDETGAAACLEAISHLAHQGHDHGPVAIADHLGRLGKLTEPARKALLDATTAGSEPLAVRQLAAAVVAASLRRRFESAGKALVEGASVAPEHDLVPLVRSIGTAIVKHADRLRVLRGEVSA